jgi:hypothetical protein
MAQHPHKAHRVIKIPVPCEFNVHFSLVQASWTKSERRLRLQLANGYSAVRQSCAFSGDASVHWGTPVTVKFAQTMNCLPK